MSESLEQQAEAIAWSIHYSINDENRDALAAEILSALQRVQAETWEQAAQEVTRAVMSEQPISTIAAWIVTAEFRARVKPVQPCVNNLDWPTG